MGETKKRKVHTPEFTAKAGLEVLRGAKTINGIGQEYAVFLPCSLGSGRRKSGDKPHQRVGVTGVLSFSTPDCKLFFGS